MATRQQGRIVETPTEARQGEPGPSVLALLTVSTGLAVLILGVVWFVFFRTCGERGAIPAGGLLGLPIKRVRRFDQEPVGASSPLDRAPPARTKIRRTRL